MRAYNKYILSFLLLLGLILGSCKKLDRDNPQDAKGTSNPATSKGPDMKFSKFEIYSDNNGDGQVNKGESVKLKVFLKNTGGEKANKVRSTFSCSNPNITALTPVSPVNYYDSSYNDYIDSGAEGSPTSPTSYLGFSVSNTVQAGTSVVINISITDGDGNSWSESFHITISGSSGVIAFSRFEVYSDNNVDGIINKGESVKLKVYLKNNGSSKVNKVRCTITSSSNYITSLTPISGVSYYDASYNDYLEAGSEGAPTSPTSYLSFNVSNTIPHNTIVTFSLTITDESNNSWTDTFTVTVVNTSAVLRFMYFDVYSDNNNDKIINKGESVKLKVYLKNIGSSRANKIRASISTTNSDISSLTPVSPVAFYDSSYNDYVIAGDDCSPSSVTSYLSFNVSSGATPGSIISFSISINDESGNTWSDVFTITVY
jgi:hypothetical protein